MGAFIAEKPRFNIPRPRGARRLVRDEGGNVKDSSLFGVARHLVHRNVHVVEGTRLGNSEVGTPDRRQRLLYETELH